MLLSVALFGRFTIDELGVKAPAGGKLCGTAPSILYEYPPRQCHPSPGLRPLASRDSLNGHIVLVQELHTAGRDCNDPRWVN